MEYKQGTIEILNEKGIDENTILKEPTTKELEQSRKMLELIQLLKAKTCSLLAYELIQNMPTNQKENIELIDSDGCSRIGR